MADSWKISGEGPKPVIEAALDRQAGDEAWDPDIVVTGFEIAEDRPDDWVLQAYLPREPSSADIENVTALFEKCAPDMTIEALPEEDWVTVSQQGVEPIRAGRFHVHTPDFPADDSGDVIDFVIPAAQAFGTGQHETTAGCLEMLDAMEIAGCAPGSVADIGTGTGLLGFGARRLWPDARVILSDIDPVCGPVVEENARNNGFALGGGERDVAMVIADGMGDPALAGRAPYDLLIANILAAPLIAMAHDFAGAVRDGGEIILAGLLETQQADVLAAYEAQGCTLEKSLVRGDWSILWLRKRALT